MPEKIETLDEKTSIFINAFSHGYRVKIADGRSSVISWHLYAFQLVRAWSQYFAGDQIDFNFHARNFKVPIKGLLQMTEQFVGPTTVYAKDAVTIISSKELFYSYLTHYLATSRGNQKIEDIKDDLPKLLDTARVTLYGK